MDRPPRPRPPRRSRLVRRLFLLQVVTVLLTVGGLAALGVFGARELEHDAAGRLTQAVAVSVAADPEVTGALRAVGSGDVTALSARLQPVAERVRAATGTSFVVVMSTAGIRWSHYNPAEIGRVYQGDIAPALAGRTYTEVYTGTLGPSVRTVAPVLVDGRIVAVVSVGVLQTRISDLALRSLPAIVAAAAVALALGLVLASLLARRLRRQTLGLEPDEITAAYTHHDAVLHAVGEGLLVVDGGGRLVVVNAEARRLLALPGAPDPQATTGPDGGPGAPGGPGASGDPGAPAGPAVAPEPTGRPLADLDADPAVLAVLARGLTGDLRDEPALAGERVLLVNSRAAGPAAGPDTRVFTLRDRTELAGALRERDDARGTVAALSAQAHEFGNRMQTVLTLLELGDTADASRAGVAALDRSRGPGAAVAAEVLDPVLAALLGDKAWTAAESGTTLVVTDHHRPGDLPGDRLPYAADDLVSLAGNLVDNAVEALAGLPPGSPREVRVSIGPDDGGAGLRLTVTDTGPGISDEVAADLFTYGVSTRGPGAGRPRGIGLALVDRIARRLGGSVTVAAGPGGGTEFDVRLPSPTDPAAGSPAVPSGPDARADVPVPGAGLPRT